MEDIQTLHPEDTTRTTLQKYKKHKSHSNELFSSLFSDIKQHLKDDFHSHPNHKVDPISNSMTGDTIEVKQTIERSPFHLQYATSRSSSSFSKSLHKKIVSSIYSDTEDKIDAYQSLSKRLDTRAGIRIAQLERHKQWFLYDVQKIMERRQTDYLLHKRIILQKKQNAVRRTQGLLFELLGGCEKQLFERQRRQELKRQSLKRRKIELIDDLMWRLFASRMKFDLCLLMANDLDEEKLIDFDVQDINPSKHEQLYNFLTSLLSKKISGSGNHNVVLNRITRIGPKDTHASTIHERIDDGLLESSLSLTKILSTVVKNYNFEDETKSLSNQTHQLSQTVKQTKAKPRLPLYTLITNCPIKPMLLNGRGFSQNVSQEIRVQNTKLIELCGNRIYFCLEEQFALNKIDDDYDDVFNNKIPTSMEGTGKSLHEYVLQCLYALYLPPSTAKNLNITMVQTSLVLDLKVSSLEAKHRQEQSTFTLEENRYREFIQCFPDILKVRVGKEDLHFVPASVTQLGKGMSSYEYSKTGVNSSHPKLFVPTRSVKTENGCRGNNNRPMVGAVLRPLSCTSTKILFEAYANYVSSNEYKGPEILPSLFCIPIKDSIHLPNKQNVCDCCNVSQPEFEFAKVPCKRKGSYEVLIIQYHTVTGTLDRTRNFEDLSNIWHDFSLCRWTSCMMKSMKMSSHCLCKEHEKILKITTTRNEEEQLSARQICTLNQPNQQMNAINNPEMLDTKLIKTSENLLNELKSGALMSSVKGFWSSTIDEISYKNIFPTRINPTQENLTTPFDEKSTPKWCIWLNPKTVDSVREKLNKVHMLLDSELFIENKINETLNKILHHGLENEKLRQFHSIIRQNRYFARDMRTSPTTTDLWNIFLNDKLEFLINDLSREEILCRKKLGVIQKFVKEGTELDDCQEDIVGFNDLHVFDNSSDLILSLNRNKKEKVESRENNKYIAKQTKKQNATFDVTNYKKSPYLSAGLLKKCRRNRRQIYT